MAGGIVYLDVDDEITSAAARVRDTEARRVALVLPYGSRVATSRINFRLLSRDAMINEKQLAVVSGDSATRALAASAGLPVFASVAEYESSQALGGEEHAAPPSEGGPTAAGSTVPGDAPAQPGPAPTTAKRSRRGSAAKAPTAPATPAPGTEDAARADDGGADVPVATTLQGVPPASREQTEAASEATVRVEMPWVRQPAEDRTWVEPRSSSAPPGAPSTQRPPVGPTSRRGSRLPLVIGLAALGLLVLVGGVAAYVVLPSVSVVVTARPEALVPLDITVTADPTATQVDAAARVVPAERISLEVSVQDSFPATGKRVEEAEAAGAVRFSNLDFLRANPVPAGSIVSTNAGVRFRTVAAVTVPRADLVGLTVFPGRITVNVIAVEPGTAGNVEPNTVVIVPRGEDPQALKVVNPDATSGGTHEEFPQVTQEDVDAAIEQLGIALTDAFQARLVDPAIAPAGATLFPETALLGEPAPSVEPDTLVGQEIATFEVGMTATGTVVTVDPAPVAMIADELLRATLEPGHELVADSIHVDVGPPVVSGQSVDFSATATGEQVAVLDPAVLRDLILGKALGDAREVLAPFGDVELTAWPDWVGSVPTIVDRVDVRIEEGVPVETPATSESTS